MKTQGESHWKIVAICRSKVGINIFFPQSQLDFVTATYTSIFMHILNDPTN